MKELDKNRQFFSKMEPRTLSTLTIFVTANLHAAILPQITHVNSYKRTQSTKYRSTINVHSYHQQDDNLVSWPRSLSTQNHICFKWLCTLSTLTNNDFFSNDTTNYVTTFTQHSDQPYRYNKYLFIWARTLSTSQRGHPLNHEIS